MRNDNAGSGGSINGDGNNNSLQGGQIMNIDEKIVNDAVGQENEDALKQAYDEGHLDGYAEGLEDGRQEGYMEAIKALENLL